MPYLVSFFNFKKLIDVLGRGREKKKNIDLLFHLFMHSLVASCMCPDLGISGQHSNHLSNPTRANICWILLLLDLVPHYARKGVHAFLILQLSALQPKHCDSSATVDVTLCQISVNCHKRKGRPKSGSHTFD